ncbi:MAG: bifunctional diguanylate cyclase/phosphodiesterase [Lachnospiraceae bacterium]|nr:bifunctional diguanylate cyclase/phosphodiesterase [Lachnospiraceae bacterium]
MELNFYLEGAGFILAIILCFACGVRYNIIDLKNKIYVGMVRVNTVLLGLNMVAYSILHYNIIELAGVAEVIICLSFLQMVMIWFYFNNYLLELIHNRNYVPAKVYYTIGIPVLVDVLLLVSNLALHHVFDVTEVEGQLRISFNDWYVLPYALAAVSVIVYIGIVLKNIRTLREMGQSVFLIIPFIMVVAYVFQYQHTFTAVMGLSYAIILILIYIFSYSTMIKLDTLTHLPDGDTFKKMLQYRIGSNKKMMVAMLSLDDFKRINSEFGYQNGDKFIHEIAAYLVAHSPKRCVSRYGGDKFTIIFEDTTVEDMKIWCDQMMEHFRMPCQIGKLVVHKITVCISVVEYPRLADSPSEIIELLEYLNSYAKANKKNQYIICDDAFKGKMERRVHIFSILKEVIEKGKMYVNYQPILDVNENCYNRVEALFRLRDDYLGDISPGEFFPIAEENGYVKDIGYILIDKVCQFIRSYLDDGKEPPIVSVNFSRQQIMAKDVEKKVLAILDKYELNPRYLAIELPEEVFSVQYYEVKKQMMKLYDKGIHFYLDGFGTGFLDLIHLIELPFEIIKINKNMIRAAEHNDTIYLLISAMTAVFEENQKQILGDGIESEKLKELSDLLFMNYLQGYYFSEPVSEEEIKEYLEQRDVIDRSHLDDMLAGMGLDGNVNMEEFALSGEFNPEEMGLGVNPGENATDVVNKI